MYRKKLIISIPNQVLCFSFVSIAVMEAKPRYYKEDLLKPQLGTENNIFSESSFSGLTLSLCLPCFLSLILYLIFNNNLLPFLWYSISISIYSLTHKLLVLQYSIYYQYSKKLMEIVYQVSCCISISYALSWLFFEVIFKTLNQSASRLWRIRPERCVNF